MWEQNASGDPVQTTKLEGVTGPTGLADLGGARSPTLSSLSGLSPERGRLLWGGSTPSELGALSAEAAGLEYDEDPPPLEGSFLAMDPQAYTLTWAQSPGSTRRLRQGGQQGRKRGGFSPTHDMTPV